MILRICICIPTFNNDKSIEGVILDCLKQTSFPILVVDDGSDQPVATQFKTPEVHEALKTERLRIIRFSKNRGKGTAIQNAFTDCIARGFTHLLTIDGDGQHLPHEIPKLLDRARQAPWDLIIGKRKFEDSAPAVSKFGNRFSNYWVKYETGFRAIDSQSGFRLYPLFHVQLMRFFTKRFDFEIEVLIRLLWKRVRVQEVPVDVYYPPQSQRVSHFNKFTDNVRISFLNTILVILTLFRTHLTPKELGIATGLGVVVGCSPFYGFHTPLVIALSLLLRLNVGVMWLGSNIAIPPTAPFLAFGAIATGCLITGNPVPMDPSQMSLEMAGQFFLYWLYGFLVFGSLLGLLIGLVVYLVALRMQARRSRQKTPWRGRNRGGSLGNAFLKYVTRYLGLRFGYFCLYFIVPYFYLFAPRATRASHEYWRVTQPPIPFLLRPFYVLRHYLQFGKILLDRLYQSHFKEHQFVSRPHGFHHILQPLKKKRGLILLGAHMGGWDIAARYMEGGGLHTPFHSVQHRPEGLSFETLKEPEEWTKLQTHFSNAGNQSILEIYDLLRNGQPVGLMGDRPIGDQVALVLFFGKLALFDTTAFRIAATCQVDLLFSCGFKRSISEYDFYATPSKPYAFKEGEDKELYYWQQTQAFAFLLESFVKRHPFQWFNFFRFWSALPQLSTPKGKHQRPHQWASQWQLPEKPSFDWELDP